MTDNLNDRLQQSMHGQPQTNIDERNQYMGSLRERTFLRLSVKEATDEKIIGIFMKHFSDYAEYKILINGTIAQTPLINQVIGLCAKNNTQFIIVSDNTAHDDPDAAGILVVSDHAINEETIDIKDKYPSQETSNVLEASKKDHEHSHFFKKIFGR